MAPDQVIIALNELAAMKRELKERAARDRLDRLAVEVMTTEAEPLKMADNLKHWLDLHAA
jgi:hypothetical protein